LRKTLAIDPRINILQELFIIAHNLAKYGF